MFRLSDSKKKKLFRAITIANVMLMSSLLFGCGENETYETKLAIDKDGGVVSTIYESFEADYYDASELADMAASEASYYNSEYISPKITVEEPVVFEDEHLVKLTMTYKSATDYSHFNQSTLFYGTLQEALDAGLYVSDSLVGSDGELISAEKLSDFSEKHIIITTEKILIDAPYEILYTTKGVTKKGKKEAILTDATADSIQLLLSK